MSIERGAFWDLPYLKRLALNSNPLLMAVNSQAFVGAGQSLQQIDTDDCPSLEKEARQLLDNITMAATSRLLKVGGELASSQAAGQQVLRAEQLLAQTPVANKQRPLHNHAPNGGASSQQQRSLDGATLATGSGVPGAKLVYSICSLALVLVLLNLVLKYTSTRRYLLEARRRRHRVYSSALGEPDGQSGRRALGRGQGGRRRRRRRRKSFGDDEEAPAKRGPDDDDSDQEQEEQEEEEACERSYDSASVGRPLGSPSPSSSSTRSRSRLGSSCAESLECGGLGGQVFALCELRAQRSSSRTSSGHCDELAGPKRDQLAPGDIGERALEGAQVSCSSIGAAAAAAAASASIDMRLECPGQQADEGISSDVILSEAGEQVAEQVVGERAKEATSGPGLHFDAMLDCPDCRQAAVAACCSGDLQQQQQQQVSATGELGQPSGQIVGVDETKISEQSEGLKINTTLGMIHNQLVAAGYDYGHANCAHFYHSLGPALQLADLTANFVNQMEHHYY